MLHSVWRCIKLGSYRDACGPPLPAQPLLASSATNSNTRSRPYFTPVAGDDPLQPKRHTHSNFRSPFLPVACRQEFPCVGLWRRAAAIGRGEPLLRRGRHSSTPRGGGRARHPGSLQVRQVVRRVGRIRRRGRQGFGWVLAMVQLLQDVCKGAMERLAFARTVSLQALS